MGVSLSRYLPVYGTSYVRVCAQYMYIFHYGYCMCTCVGTQNTAWGWRLGEVNRVGCLRRQEDLSPYFVMVEENRRMKKRVNRLDTG